MCQRDRSGLQAPAHLDELSIAVGASLLAVATEQLGEQADALLHLVYGVDTLGDLLHALLVLGREGESERERAE